VAARIIETCARAFDLLADALGDIPLTDIAGRLSEIESAMAFRGKNKDKSLSPVTRSILIRPLRQAWSFGIRQGVQTENPFKKIDILEDSDAPYPDILSQEEKDLICENLPEVAGSPASLTP